MVWGATSAQKRGALASLSHLCPRLIGSMASGKIRPSIYERVEALALAYGRPPLAATSTPLKECQWQKPSIARRRTDCASERRRPGVMQAWGPPPP
jgi:hypothetical protein